MVGMRTAGSVFEGMCVCNHYHRGFQRSELRVLKGLAENELTASMQYRKAELQAQRDRWTIANLVYPHQHFYPDCRRNRCDYEHFPAGVKRFKNLGRYPQELIDKLTRAGRIFIRVRGQAMIFTTYFFYMFDKVLIHEAAGNNIQPQYIDSHVVVDRGCYEAGAAPLVERDLLHKRLFRVLDGDHLPDKPSPFSVYQDFMIVMDVMYGRDQWTRREFTEWQVQNDKVTRKASGLQAWESRQADDNEEVQRPMEDAVLRRLKGEETLSDAENEEVDEVEMSEASDSNEDDDSFFAYVGQL